jgi:NTE family protein
LITDKTLLLKTHPCSRGLRDETIREIADACEVLRVSSEEVVHEANSAIDAMYFVAQGRLRLSVVDLQGKETVQGFQVAGGQFGGLGATTAEALPIRCVAAEPTLLLRIGVSDLLELTKRHDVFRMNIVAIVVESVKQTLLPTKSPRRPNFVGVVHHSAETRQLSRRLYSRLASIDDRIAVLHDIAGWQAIDGVVERRADDLPTEEIRQQVFEWLDRGRRVFFDASTSLDLERLKILFEVSVQICWCVTPESWETSMEVLRRLVSEAPGWRDKIVIVWLLGRETAAPLARGLRQLAQRDLKVALREPGDDENRALSSGFERLVHLVRGIQIGIALGGGAARGMAHLGVLKALEDNGICIDQIAGTSAGAMTGTLYASGMGVDFTVDRFVNELRPSWPFRLLPRGDEWYLLYKYRRRQFGPMLRNYLGDHHLEQLPISAKTVTVDLVAGQVVVREHGNAVHGIEESINLPVLAPPINRAGQALVDGGMINNVPADVLVASGCNFVIAVSVTAKMELVFADNRPDTPAESMKRASTIQTVMRTYLVQNTSINAIGVQPADIVIEPDVTQFELTAFTRTDELARIGEQTALQSLSTIRALLHQLDPQLFPEGA